MCGRGKRHGYLREILSIIDDKKYSEEFLVSSLTICCSTTDEFHSCIIIHDIKPATTLVPATLSGRAQVGAYITVDDVASGTISMVSIAKTRRCSGFGETVADTLAKGELIGLDRLGITTPPG